MTVKTSFMLRHVEFQNRVFVASGTFGYGDEINDLVDPNKLGGIVTKSLSWKPRDGNPPRRIAETPSGMLNSIGLANIGVHTFIEKKLPFLRTLKTRIIVNIAASSVQEYCDVLALLERHDGIHGYEINVSCPNVKEGGLSFGTNVDRTREITERLRPLTEKPLIIKLTPNVTHMSEFARAVKDAGADAVSCINTLVGMAVDVRTRTPRLSTVTGGLSGPAIKPIALAKVFEVAKSVDIPIFGIGGIATADDAIEFLLVGACAVQVGTTNFVDPGASVRIAEGIAGYASSNGIDDVGKLVGSLKADVKASVLQTWL
ncbi:MAG: dihydroorotate dehydrogenase B catalytic subunit [Ignavibacteria bacterium GWC2_56_12]|nr:MAG: dihydroorotate dehydrogenase B catalytic subunit [Ignavibacteria bacterium GWC2_56_12]